MNGRRRKNRITSLEQEEGVTEGEEQLMKYITEFYKNLFGHPDGASISLAELELVKISEEDKKKLLMPFSLQEIREVVFGMEKNKSPGPDGFPADFYQGFWDLVKWDLKALIDDFGNGTLDIARLNYGIITLVPKTADAKQIQKFRPICLLNVSFKIITKVLMNSLTRCVSPVISPTQTAFVRGRYIMERVVILHEALNPIHSKNRVL